MEYKSGLGEGRSRDSVGVETRLRAGRSGVCIPAAAVNVSLLPNGRTGCGARGYRGASPESESPGRVWAVGSEGMSGTVLLLTL